MNQLLWKESLLSHRKQIIELADHDDVTLDYLIDHLLTARCLQLDQKEVIKIEKTARARCGKLLDFVHTEGLKAFNALCQALENFGTEHKKDLADSLRAESKSPTLKHVIPSDGRRPVVGLTFINNELFVLRQPSKKEIQVYETTTFTQQRTVRVAGLSDDVYWLWWGKSLTSCDVNNCLFVCDPWNVYKVDLSTNNVINWRVDGLPIGLSVNDARHVIVTCYHGNEIQEYEQTGQLIRTIKLQKSHVTAPCHAVQLDESMFVVSHTGPMQGVSLIDTRGRVTATYRNSESTSVPRQLTVGKNGSVLVVDCNNNRLVVLDASLKIARELTLPIDGGLNRPRCLCFNESLGQLFVGEDDGQRVVICDNVRI